AAKHGNGGHDRPVSATMAAITVCVSAVALFDTGFLALYGMSNGWPITTAAAVLIAFAVGSGGVRAPAVWAAGRVGRRRVARTALAVGAVAQLGLLDAHHPLLVANCLAGAAVGTWYALFPGLSHMYPVYRPARGR
ncbi:MAG TPA: MFS transporter, partial [Pseudonocardiaceae bacterium]